MTPTDRPLPLHVRVVIIGGGPAGCATALRLHQLGVSDVLVIEAGQYQRERVGESVPPDFRRVLATLGLLESFPSEAHATCLGSRSAWGTETLGYNDFIVDPHGPGWHLDRSEFERWLADSVRARGMLLSSNTRFRDVAPNRGSGRILSLERDGQAILVKADFVVDAGGVQALLASRLGARRQCDDQMLVAAAFLDVDADAVALDSLTLLEAEADGWWYAARLPSGRAIVAFSSDADVIRSRRMDQVSGWLTKAAATRHIAELTRAARWRHERPIRLLAASSVLEPCVGADWLAVGDAASSFDPISAQGLHKAFVQGVAAADAINTALQGDASALLQYGLMVRTRYAQYWQQRRYFYALEQRWPESPFWQRRQAA
ncbi:hypothetical protein C7S18_15575 [Ahniella affigens]|uniref:FAD-binding domain-containing protein n=1 Tax=Ahniella affigens TaxID=2021234 RepID=A0A2P1PUK1_9GAMM|nr:tryptophan 7-halogenase [Ahniella affigens]AVP98518.1 hypothetical protein C7S18_15575 [Ahniella affigens]